MARDGVQERPHHEAGLLADSVGVCSESKTPRVPMMEAPGNGGLHAFHRGPGPLRFENSGAADLVPLDPPPHQGTGPLENLTQTSGSPQERQASKDFCTQFREGGDGQRPP